MGVRQVVFLVGMVVVVLVVFFVDVSENLSVWVRVIVELFFELQLLFLFLRLWIVVCCLGVR